ncbi:MAG: nucleoside recognition family protein [Clostridiales bacterium 38-18]|nr:MAG: nucleoside recognition family protein [Clostridiales bacterium 38-18]
MEKVIQMMLESGKVGVELSLYTILPIMVIMMAIMNVLDKKNILSWIAKGVAPLMLLFGLPGLGVFAILQILFISFAAPVATLKIIDQDDTISDASLAATLAAILVMAQANAVFPLTSVGLNLPVGIATSLVGGLIASLIAYKLLKGKEAKQSDKNSIETHHLNKDDSEKKLEALEATHKKKSIIALLFDGGESGLAIVLKSIPPLIIAVFLVNVLKTAGVIGILETILSPVLTAIGIPSVAVLPIVTKFIAGGTAMMAIILDLMKQGLMTAQELNRVAGFTLNPLDPVGLAVLVATGPRVAKVAKPAILAAVVGIIIRGILHLIIFN